MTSNQKRDANIKSRPQLSEVVEVLIILKFETGDMSDYDLKRSISMGAPGGAKTIQYVVTNLWPIPEVMFNFSSSVVHVYMESIAMA